MFHSDQILDITCDGRNLSAVIRFAFELHDDEMFKRRDGRVRVAVSEPIPGVYAIGRGSMAEIKNGPNKGRKHDTPVGWEDVPCAYDPDILSVMTKQWLDQNLPDEAGRPGGDGTIKPGFRVRSFASARDAIPGWKNITGWNPNGVILIITPCWIPYYK